MVRCTHIALLLVVAGCASGQRLDGDDATDDDGVASDDVTPPDARPDGAPLAPDAFVPLDAPMVQPDACVPAPVERLGNPAFDGGPGGGWLETPIVFNGNPVPIVQLAPSGATFTAHSGTYVAWLGGLASIDDFLELRTLTDVIEQSFTIPAGSSGFTIAGQYLVQTGEDPSTSAFDTFKLELVAAGGGVIDTPLVASNATAPTAATWTAFSRTIGANLAGQTVRIRATSSNDFTSSTSFFLDSLTFTSIQPCP